MRQLAKYLGAAVVVMLTTSCHTGPSAKKFGPVRKGGGANVSIKLPHRGRVRGELVEVRDSGLMLLNGCTLTAVPFSSILDTDFDGIDPEYGSAWPSPSERAELKLLSRFPSGIPAAVVEEFARCSGRPTPTGIGRGTASPPNAEQFLAAARAGTVRFQQLDSAIAAGYRRIGDDLPSQGEHWVHTALVMSGRIEPARPSVLIYVRTPDGPRLAGVAWTTVLGAGDPYPDQPVGAAAWHEHNGTVADETLPLHHHHGVDAAAAQQSTRIAILHGWIWTANPRGVWVADNWALPFLRAGLAPNDVPLAAAQALSLTAPGAIAYYQRAVETAAGSGTAFLARVRSALDKSAAVAQEVRRGADNRLRNDQLEGLATVWNELWMALADGVGAPQADAIRRLSIAMR